MEGSRTREGAAEVKQLISFVVGAEEYGLELLKVEEVIRMRQITWLPKAPSCVKGIINLRGDIIPVIDLRDRLGLDSAEQSASTRVIVVEVGGQTCRHGGRLRQPGGARASRSVRSSAAGGGDGDAGIDCGSRQDGRKAHHHDRRGEDSQH